MASKLTPRQTTVLRTLAFADRMTPQRIGVRSDVLWRMEERGLVARNAHDQWRITPKGRDALGDTR